MPGGGRKRGDAVALAKAWTLARAAGMADDVARRHGMGGRSDQALPAWASMPAHEQTRLRSP